MKAKFKLRKGAKTNTILLDFRYGRSIRYRCSTQININKGQEKFWDSKKEKIKIPSSIINDKEINKKLYEIELEIEKEVLLLEEHNRLTSNSCAKVIKRILGFEEENYSRPKYSKNVLEYIEWYKEYYKTNNSPVTKRPLKAGTLKTYKNVSVYLNRYFDSRNIKNFLFDDMGREFYNDFIQFGVENNYSRNYVGIIIQRLKTVISSAYDNDVHKNVEFKKRYFSKIKEEVNHPYLTEEELDLISEVKLKNDIEKDARDAFLIACNTGMRVSDLNAFLKNPKLVEDGGKKYIQIIQQKTDSEVYITVNQKVLDIIEKRNGEFPPNVRPNIISENIKIICKKAGITSEHVLELTLGGKKTKITKPKYMFISTHTGRRSFCTNAYNAGIPPHQIMTISGHKSEKVFFNYIKASVKRKAVQIAGHPFFN
jgi:integrase